MSMFNSRVHLGILGLLLSAGHKVPDDDLLPYIESDEHKARERKEDYQRLLAKRGVQTFIIEGQTIIARDYANAIRKFNNKNKIGL